MHLGEVLCGHVIQLLRRDDCRGQVGHAAVGHRRPHLHESATEGWRWQLRRRQSLSWHWQLTKRCEAVRSRAGALRAAPVHSLRWHPCGRAALAEDAQDRIGAALHHGVAQLVPKVPLWIAVGWCRCAAPRSLQQRLALRRPCLNGTHAKSIAIQHPEQVVGRSPLLAELHLADLLALLNLAGQRHAEHVAEVRGCSDAWA
mmetsp:Transcript_140603/g.391915  ORF Transcript_140603/g.391915 Transcript_140603/m.391915 type:complete len:201 (-) Transcript_140603:58-660(-)